MRIYWCHWHHPQTAETVAEEPSELNEYTAPGVRNYQWRIFLYATRNVRLEWASILLSTFVLRVSCFVRASSHRCSAQILSTSTKSVIQRETSGDRHSGVMRVDPGLESRHVLLVSLRLPPVLTCRHALLLSSRPFNPHSTLLFLQSLGVCSLQKFPVSFCPHSLLLLILFCSVSLCISLRRILLSPVVSNFAKQVKLSGVVRPSSGQVQNWNKAWSTSATTNNVTCMYFAFKNSHTPLLSEYNIKNWCRKCQNQKSQEPSSLIYLWVLQRSRLIAESICWRTDHVHLCFLLLIHRPRQKHRMRCKTLNWFAFWSLETRKHWIRGLV